MKGQQRISHGGEDSPGEAAPATLSSALPERGTWKFTFLNYLIINK
ncbi:hypothetical protein PQ469_08440 [Mucilaginibacter sp. KACC 22773]|nr:hypothetical protein [Mucilaginibacter sp. KACC 22773]WDF80031.1 hypothetical protein PQ469_08440 [Mucilaginibacter sp. KACC 22773]